MQAQQIAERIRASMLKLSLHNYEQTTIPMPTVSQGIAIYPLEADGVMKLIDLADKRLYVAKERGRNQVEPDKSHWEKLYETNGKSKVRFFKRIGLSFLLQNRAKSFNGFVNPRVINPIMSHQTKAPRTWTRLPIFHDLSIYR